MSVTVGDTFVFEGDKFVVRLIDLVGTHPKNKTGEPRIDASKFIRDEFGEEKIQKGRPKKFEPSVVFNALGVSPPDGFDSEPESVIESGFERVSEDELAAARARIAEEMASLDDATTADW